jgi:hypothetical protein
VLGPDRKLVGVHLAENLIAKRSRAAFHDESSELSLDRDLPYRGGRQNERIGGFQLPQDGRGDLARIFEQPDPDVRIEQCVQSSSPWNARSISAGNGVSKSSAAVICPAIVPNRRVGFEAMPPPAAPWLSSSSTMTSTRLPSNRPRSVLVSVFPEITV